MNFIEYFPLGLAKNKAFCNRVKEQEILHKNIEGVLHTVLVSPRRYGKSSLAVKVIEDSSLAYEVIDLFVAKDAESIEKYILIGLQNLINKVISMPEYAIKLLKTSLKNLNAKLVFGTSGFNIEFSVINKDVAGNILDALQALDQILVKNNKKAILFIDEFQQIGVLANGRGIEGAIRNIAQSTRNIIFIFSGSNRHLLTHMFHDSNRPFYKLCIDIRLKRISQEDYIKYLNRLSQKAWKSELSDEVFTQIFKCTEIHPYYMNVLCMRIWFNSQKPNARLVQKIWEEFVFEERSKTINELNKLTLNQYLILDKVAHGYNKLLTSHAFLTTTKIPSASAISAIDFLEKNDYIYKENEEYKLIDPLIKSSLLLFSNDC